METLTLPAHLDSLSAIGKYIMTISEEAGIPRKRAYNLRLAVDEAVSNIIIHGCAGEGDILEINAEINSESLKIIVVDTGKSYDPRDRVFDESVLSLPIEERPMGGLGIFLSLQNVDEFSYQVEGQKNVSSFSLKRSPTES